MHEGQDPKALTLSLTHKQPQKWTSPYLAATVLVVVMIQALPLHQGQVLPGLNVVAQMDEDFSITENLAFVEREKRVKSGDGLGAPGVPVIKQLRRATFVMAFFFHFCCVYARTHTYTRTEIMPYVY